MQASRRCDGAPDGVDLHGGVGPLMDSHNGLRQHGLGLSSQPPARSLPHRAFTCRTAGLRAMAWLLGLGLSLLCLTPAAAVERVWLRYGEIAELHETFESIAPEQRRGLRLRLRLDPSVPVPVGGLRLFVSPTARVEVPIHADHLVVLPRGVHWRQEDPEVLLQAPPGVKVGLVVEVGIDPPAQGSRSYADWMQSVQQAAAGIRKHAGFWALFMPKATGLDLRFAKGDAAVASLEVQGVMRRWQADANGRLIVPLDAELLSSPAPLQLSHAPLLALPHFKTTMTLMPSGESAVK
ncbi:hypothetical protein KAK06_13640 [Ideonella sp. 4Y11]|uniref:DUF2987 domain-containing protein n=1 Tax=Ideonella aquatica TaxID=2824119 RepID=A0A940YL57_9BURK|nr:hypothetical protein [Ideonella aquatica]MBQ0959991.1 hypothetical protein [Ideonella aquatica]